MTITTVETTNCESMAENPVEQISIWQLPKIFWIAVILFCINLAFGIGLFITRDADVDVYGREVGSVYPESVKQSPFTEVVDTTKHKTRYASKVRPIVESVPFYEAEPVANATSSQTMATTSEHLFVTRSGQVEQLDLPVRTARSYESERSTDVQPSSVNAKEPKVVVIN